MAPQEKTHLLIFTICYLKLDFYYIYLLQLVRGVLYELYPAGYFVNDK